MTAASEIAESREVGLGAHRGDARLTLIRLDPRNLDQLGETVPRDAVLVASLPNTNIDILK